MVRPPLVTHRNAQQVLGRAGQTMAPRPDRAQAASRSAPTCRELSPRGTVGASMNPMLICPLAANSATCPELVTLKLR